MNLPGWTLAIRVCTARSPDAAISVGWYTRSMVFTSRSARSTGALLETRFESDIVHPVHEAPLIQMTGGPLPAASAFSSGASVAVNPRAAAEAETYEKNSRRVTFIDTSK